MQRLQIEKKEARLLEQSVKEVEADMKIQGASPKNIRKVYNEGVQHFF